MSLSQGSQTEEIILELSGGHSAISSGKEGAGESERRCEDGSRHWSDVGPRAKEGGQPLEAGKNKEMGSPLKPPE